jgi:type VI secretion system secreted protein Hcp
MAADYFLRICDPKSWTEPENIEGRDQKGGILIQGESTKVGNKDEIELLSWSWGLSNPSAGAFGSGASKGRVAFGDFSLMKYTDKATGPLRQACLKGSFIPGAILSTRRMGQETGTQSGKPTMFVYFYVVFEGIIIASFSDSGSSGGGIPSESLSIRAQKVRVNYRQIVDGKPKGWMPFGWSIMENKPY